MDTEIKSDLFNEGYYLIDRNFGCLETTRIRRRANGAVLHNHGWVSDERWLIFKPIKINPTIWDRIANFI